MQPHLHVSLIVEADHAAGDLELPHHAEAYTVPPDRLAEQVQRCGEGQLRQVLQSGANPLNRHPQHLRVAAEGGIVALGALHSIDRNKCILLCPPILINLIFLLHTPSWIQQNPHDLRLGIAVAIPNHSHPILLPQKLPLPLNKPEHLRVLGLPHSHVTITTNGKAKPNPTANDKIINIINKQLKERMIEDGIARPEVEADLKRGEANLGEVGHAERGEGGSGKGEGEVGAGGVGAGGAGEEAMEREARRTGEGKLKYKKLKQRLSWLSEQMQDQGLVKQQKDITSPNKSRLMKLALQLEKSLKTQAIDYLTLQSLLREIQKIVEHRREHDLLILRAARLMATLFLIIRRFPSLHKSEAQQSQSSLEASLRLLRIMLSLGSSREALLVGNQMPSLLSLLSCALMREDRRIASVCLQLLNVVLHGPNRAELHPLLTANIEFILCSSLLKRMKGSIATCIAEDDPAHAEFVLLAFKFYYLILSFSCQGQVGRPIYAAEKPSDNLSEAIRGYFESGVQWLSQSAMDLLFEKEGEGEQRYTPRQEDLPNFKINILLYLIKSLNLIFFADISASQKILECTTPFLQILRFLLQTTKANFQQSVEMKNLCSEIIILLGHLAFQSFQNQQRIRLSGLLQSLCNHPLEYIMQPSLRNILVPTFCCLIHNNPQNFKQTFKENSVQPILQYIEREINARTEREQLFTDITLTSKKNLSHTLSRKTSVSSLNSTYSKASVSESFSTQTSNSLLGSEVRLQHRFRPENWQRLAFDLRQMDD